jgi:hypothetical protein
MSRLRNDSPASSPLALEHTCDPRSHGGARSSHAKRILTKHHSMPHHSISQRFGLSAGRPDNPHPCSLWRYLWYGQILGMRSHLTDECTDLNDCATNGTVRPIPEWSNRERSTHIQFRFIRTG